MAVNTQPWFLEHKAQWANDPVVAHDWDATSVGGRGIVPTLLLTATGAKTGEARSLPLLYQPCGEGFLIVGSRGRSSRHPGWYLNLLHEPQCTAVIGPMIYSLRARKWRRVGFFSTYDEPHQMNQRLNRRSHHPTARSKSHLITLCTVLLVLVTVTLGACSAQQAYNAMVENQRTECLKRPPTQQADCMEGTHISYEEYLQRRNEAMTTK